MADRCTCHRHVESCAMAAGGDGAECTCDAENACRVHGHAAQVAAEHEVARVARRRRRNVRFKISARLDMASKLIDGTVTIDPAGTFSVRPARRRRTYDLPLDVVADLVVRRVVQAEVFKKRIAKAKERAQRTGRRRQ